MHRIIYVPFVTTLMLLVTTLACDPVVINPGPSNPVSTTVSVTWDSGGSTCFGNIRTEVTIVVDEVDLNGNVTEFDRRTYITDYDETSFDINIPATSDYNVSVRGNSASNNLNTQVCDSCCDTGMPGTNCTFGGGPRYFGSQDNSTFVLARFSSCSCC